jgi:undecaprenyl pyrophosphate synthase
VHREYFTSRLLQAAQLSDVSEADIILVIGPVFTLAGFPPWQARSSEVYHIDCQASDALISVQRVVEAYFATLQRFGA